MTEATAGNSDLETVAPAGDGRPTAGKARWSRRNLVRLAVAVVIAAAAAEMWLDNFGYLLDEPRCRPPGQDMPAGCIAHVRMNILVDARSTVGLTPDGGTLLVTGVAASPVTDRYQALELAGIGVADGKEEWRTPLDDTDHVSPPLDGDELFISPPPQIAVSPSGTKAAVWRVGDKTPVNVVHVPGGRPLVKVPPVKTADGRLLRKIWDVMFSEDEAALIAGISARRGVISLADPAAEPAIAPGFDRPDCHGPGEDGYVGQSHMGIVRSRDNKMVALLLSRPPLGLEIGGSYYADVLRTEICGARWTAAFEAPDDWQGARGSFASFSPANNRLAIIYGQRWHGGLQTLIEIWDTAIDGPQRLKRLGAFQIPGSVGYRIGWSQDGHRLAAVRYNKPGSDAFIYAIP